MKSDTVNVKVELGNDWKKFKKELHNAINKHGSEHIDIVRDESCVYAIRHTEKDSLLVTKRYVPSILTQYEMENWRKTLGLNSIPTNSP